MESCAVQQQRERRRARRRRTAFGACCLAPCRDTPATTSNQRAQQPPCHHPTHYLFLATTRFQVIRGYVGDRSAEPVLDGALGAAFGVLGAGYQRPLELATLRLQNMAAVLSDCERVRRLQGLGFRGCLLAPLHCAPAPSLFRPTSPHPQHSQTLQHTIKHAPMRAPTQPTTTGGSLAPEEKRLLTQQGGCLVFDGRDTLFRCALGGGGMRWCECRMIGCYPACMCALCAREVRKVRGSGFAGAARRGAAAHSPATHLPSSDLN